MNSLNTGSLLNALLERRAFWTTATPVSGAYHAVPRAAPGHSNHVMVHLIPLDRQRLKLCKPVVRKSRSGPVRLWRIFGRVWTARTGMSSGLPTVWIHKQAGTSYISFCEDICVPTSTRVSYSKPWFTAELRKLRLQTDQALRSGDKDLDPERQ